MIFALIVAFSSCKKKGCMDRTSLNYSPEAEKDDNSCDYTSVSINSEKKALVLKTTATWCPYCGDWGVAYSINVMDNYPDAVIMQLHKNDEFSTSPGDEIREYLDYSGVPHFWVGTEDISVNSQSLLNSTIESELAESVEIALGLQTSISGSSMSVKVAAQKTESVTGEFKLAVYVLEDGQVAEQDIAGSPSDPNFVHNHVLRAEASDAGFGKAITFVGDVIEEDFTITLNSSWVSANCYPVAVLWRKNGSTYDFVNLAM